MFNMKTKHTTCRPNWREYQNSLKKPQSSAKKRRWIIAVLLFITISYSVTTCWHFFSQPNDTSPMPQPEKKPNRPISITKQDVQILLQNTHMDDLSAQQIILPIKDQQIRIETSINPDLQNHLITAMDRKNSRFIGIVVMQADTGRILALAGFNKQDPNRNPCTQGTFPAASIFKIVTAAAAIDHCGYNAYTTMRFNGYKHTLYKNQLKEKNNRYTHSLPLKDAFAQSINPVFGKLGTIYLKKKVLEKFAVAFGFNQPIHFELPLATSQFIIQDKPYNWAEIASGFNKDTRISPVHGALMASTVLNKGRMVSPTIVERIEDQTGRSLYQSKNAWIGTAMTANASEILIKLMETTIHSGTGKKAFRNYKRDQILSKLHIGGKTGNIFNRSHDARFDWFVGFAKEKKGDGQLAFAALVAHEKYIGLRAAQYVRMAMKHYFSGHFAQHDEKNKNSGS